MELMTKDVETVVKEIQKTLPAGSVADVEIEWDLEERPFLKTVTVRNIAAT